jgi:hypothetical protein
LGLASRQLAERRYVMADLNERELAGCLESISQIKPTPESTKRAIKRTGQALAGRQGHKNSLRAILLHNNLVRLAAAAVVVGAIGIGLKMFSASSEHPGKGSVAIDAEFGEVVAVDNRGDNGLDLTANAVGVTERTVVEQELARVDQMFAAADVDGLVTMLSTGQLESKIAAANYLAEMDGGVKALDALGDASREYAKADPFVAAIEQIANRTESGPDHVTPDVVVANETSVPDEDVAVLAVRPGQVRGRPRMDSGEVTVVGDVTLVEPETPEELIVADAVSEVVIAVSTEHLIAEGFYWWSAYPADVDGDGDMDVVSAAHPDNFSGYSSDLRATSSVALVEESDSSKTTGESGWSTEREGADDLDESEDGQGPVAISWWENTSRSGTTWVEHVVDPNGRASMTAFPADVDGDGDVDIIGSEEDTKAVVWWENIARGSSWVRHEVDRCRGEQLVYGADMDGDRDMDVVGATWLGGGITWWENANRRGTAWQKHVVDDAEDADYSRTHCLRVADMDGDGYSDIVASAGTNSGINWWQNPARGGDGWIRHYVVGSDGEVESVFPVDIDGDGDVDVIGSIRRRDGLTWWENVDRGGTEWTKHVIDSSYTSEQWVDAADMDNDGDLDIIGSAQRSNSVIWWENSTGGSADWVKHVLTNDFDNSFGAYAADMDGDGDLDMLAVAHSGQEIAWFENEPGTISSSIEATGSRTGLSNDPGDDRRR